MINRSEVQTSGNDDFDRIRRQRWNAARAKYGPEWVGQPPLLEAREEAFDLANYVQQAAAVGDIVDEQLAVSLYDAVHYVDRLICYAIRQSQSRQQAEAARATKQQGSDPTLGKAS